MAAWKTCKLGEVADYVVERRSAKTLTVDNYISTENLLPNRGGRIAASTLPQSGNVAAWKAEDVLISYIRPYFKKIWMTREGSGGASNDVLVVRARRAHVHPGFLYYRLSSDAFFAYMMAGANGAKMPRGNRAQIMRFAFPLPSLSEQERIAGVLGAYDDLIAVNVRRMALLEEAAYRLYRERFVTRADPAWPSRPIKDCCATIQSGGTPSRGDETLWTGGTIDWFKTKELQDSWLLSSEEKITERAVQRSAARLYPAGAILMAIYASPTLGRLGVLSREATCNQAALGFVVDEIKASKWWLFYTLLEERERFNQVARGAGQQNISGDIVKGWAVRTPPLSVALAFEQEVTPYWMALLTLARENALLREARDGLLPRLLREA